MDVSNTFQGCFKLVYEPFLDVSMVFFFFMTAQRVFILFFLWGFVVVSQEAFESVAIICDAYQKNVFDYQSEIYDGQFWG